MAKKKQLPEEVAHSEAYVKDFFDMAVPSAIRFNVDHFICGDSYRSVWAIREYPPQTSDQALLARFGDKEAVTVHLYTRLVDGVEQRKILQNASRKNKLLANSNDLEDSVTGEGNLGDVVELLGELRKNREPLLHCAVFIELSAGNLDKLRELQSDVSMEMTREKISVDHLSMRQKEGFIACMPCGYNIFGTQYERVLPASAVANLFPFNYSGKTDKNGFYLGKDKFGTNIIADFDQRADDKTNSNVLILGNSGQGTTAPEEVPTEMKQLLASYNRKPDKTLEDLIAFHVAFESIHPFQDGNGRVGRLILFKECLKNGIVPFIIDEDLKLFYYRGLHEWNTERGYLIDTCLSAQDKFKKYLDYFRIPYQG